MEFKAWLKQESVQISAPGREEWEQSGIEEIALKKAVALLGYANIREVPKEEISKLRELRNFIVAKLH